MTRMVEPATDFKQVNQDLEVINNSMTSISSNIQDITRKKKWFIYGLGVKHSLDEAKKIITKNPSYLLRDEIDYLKHLVKIFEGSYVHGCYKLKFTEWLEIYGKGLGSLKSRSNTERSRVVELGKSIDTESKIQLTFQLIRSNFLLVEKEIVKLQEIAIFDTSKIKSLMRGIGQIVNHLTRCYYFEFAYITSSNNFKLAELEEFIEDLNEFNNVLNKEDSFINFFENFVGNENETIHA